MAKERWEDLRRVEWLGRVERWEVRVKVMMAGKGRRSERSGARESALKFDASGSDFRSKGRRVLFESKNRGR